MPSKQLTLSRIKELVDNFKLNEAEYCRSDSEYNETQLRRDFIDPFFEALGWDVQNTQGLPQNLREVLHEAQVQVEHENKKKPDYAFRLGGIRKFFVETKKPSVAVQNDSGGAFQLRRYGWSAKLPVSILTNFKYFIVYDCVPAPKEGDNYRVAKSKQYHYTELEKFFDEIYDTFSRYAVYSGDFDRRYQEAIERGTAPVDDYFLSQIEKWRVQLAKDMLKGNRHITEEQLNYLVQAFINRIVFLRICEDREIEKYATLLTATSKRAREELFKLFQEADKRYNSGLFDFSRDKISLRIRINDSTLIRIIRELYYPKSPYIFSVIESNVLGDIYELYLTKTIRIRAKRVQITDKAEISHDLGVITTPDFITKEIIERTIKRICDGKSPEQISILRFLDMACGSGSFLLATYQYLLDYHLNWYISHQAESKGKIYKGKGDFWHLSVQEKKRILLNNIYGVDIDNIAAEVTKFSLLVKLLENETSSSVDSFISQASERALPSLETNIKAGNSLVDNQFYKFKSISRLTSQQLEQLNIFNWDKEFPNILKSGGFDAVIGNPPYTRIQVMQKISPVETAYYQSEKSPYISAKKNNFDKYYLFIERGHQLLRNEGLLGFITPHKFMVITAGELLRKLISEGKYLRELVHFGKEQVFGTAKANYTCILIMSKVQNQNFKLETVKDLLKWKYTINRKVFTVNSDEISSKPWIFIVGPLKDAYNRLDQMQQRLIDVADVYVGLQTSMDEIYIIKEEDIRKINRNYITFNDFKAEEWEIETDLIKPCIKDLQIQPFTVPKTNSFIIFPYKVENGEATAYSENEMKKLFPKTLKYLYRYKKLLLKRDINDFEKDKWFKFGRSQSLTKFDRRQKLIVKVLSLEPCFTYDKRNLYFTGGGNGPYYGVSLKRGQLFSIHFLQGILNSKLTDLFIKHSSSIFQRGYYSYGKQFIMKLPIKNIDLSQVADSQVHDHIVKLVTELLLLNSQLAKVRIPTKQELLKRQIQLIEDELDDAVANWYGLSDKEKEYLKDLEFI